MTYDAIGNPTSYYNGKRWTLGWSNGRQLTSAVSDTHSITYTYDVSGYRSKKTVTTSDSTVTYNYLYQNGKVVRQLWNNGNSCIDFVYDTNGRPYAMVYNGTPYYYVLNQQGDVIRVVSADGTTYASYVYDAWGRLVGSSGSMQSINPIRYRGYYYDNDIKMYYLGSRFYDPALKRFVNADSYAGTGQGLLGYNMFAYCSNNPVMRKDDGGELWLAVAGAAILGGIGGVLSAAASGDDLSVGFWVGAISSGASVLFGFGAIGGVLITGLMNGAVSSISSVYEQKANSPMESVDVGKVILAATTGVASGMISKAVSIATGSATAGSAVASAAVETVSTALTTTTSITVNALVDIHKEHNKANIARRAAAIQDIRLRQSMRRMAA